MSNKAIDEFMSWLDTIIEEYACDDSYNMFEVPSHEHHNREGFIRALELVEEKAKEFGFITPKYRGYGLKEHPKDLPKSQIKLKINGD